MSSTGEQIVNRFVTTLNERDFDGFEALFVDDYQQHQALASTTGNPVAKHAVRMYYQDRITGTPYSFYDMFRVDNGKLTEHWDVLEPLTPAAQAKNTNGQFDFPQDPLGPPLA